MARHFNGTSDLAQAAYDFTVPLPPATAVSIAAWVWRDGTASTKVLFEHGQTIGIGFDVVVDAFAGPADLVRSFNSPNSWADSYLAPSAGAWHHHVWVIQCSGGAFNAVYIDGAAVALTPQGHLNPAAHYGNDVLTLGGRLTSGVPSAWWAGKVAEWGLWTTALTARHVAALAVGVPPPFVLNDSLVGYSPLLGDPSPEPNYTAGRESFTLTGTSYVQHPGVRAQLAMVA